MIVTEEVLKLASRMTLVSAVRTFGVEFVKDYINGKITLSSVKE